MFEFLKLDLSKPAHAGALAIVSALTKTATTIDQLESTSPLVQLAVSGAIAALNLQPEVNAAATLFTDALDVAHRLVAATDIKTNGAVTAAAVAQQPAPATVGG